jgi:2-polyprenyl-3-methyl-5-hydroxy-6-metoxy-1,4-benzoquinol methylase
MTAGRLQPFRASAEHVDATRPSSTDAEYATRLRAAQTAWWKRALDVQLPYRLHLRRLRLGLVLDVGCGIGRNLVNLAGAGVGVDPNEAAVAACRARGLVAFTPEQFAPSAYATPGRFDAMLVAHVLEHLHGDDARDLVKRYLPYVRPSGRVVLITPQQAGFASDPTHVEFVDQDALERLARGLGLAVRAGYSFPLPRLAGRWFKYNEFVVVAQRT